MRVGERGCQLQGSACLLFPILGFSQLPVRSPTAWTFREYSHSSYTTFCSSTGFVRPFVTWTPTIQSATAHAPTESSGPRPPLLDAAASFRGSLKDVPNHIQYQVRSPHLRRLEPIIQAEAGAPATSRRWYRLLSTQAPGRSPKKKQNGEVGLWKQVSR